MNKIKKYLFEIFRRIFAMSLLPVMALSGAGGLFSVSAASEQIILYNEASGVSTVSLSGNQYAIQFKVSERIKSLEIYIASVALNGVPQMTASVYKWNGNFAGSVKAGPVITENFSGFSKESWLALSCIDSAGAALPAGEYILVLDNSKNGVKLELTPQAAENTRTYLNTSPRGGSVRVRVNLEQAGVLEPVSENRNEYVTTSDTWAVTDGLDRVVEVSYENTKRENKYVGLFFHTWHSTSMHVNNGFMNISEILRKYDDIEINNYKDPRWGNAATYFWDEPLWGYYRTSDEWVLRRQAELLADAQIDVVFFDNTNGTQTFLDDALTLMKCWARARADGVKTPQVVFQLPMFAFDDAAAQLRELYREIYSQGLYEDLWFYWKGKPLILAYPGQLKSGDPADQEILDFFQYRVISHAQSQDQIQVQDRDGTPLVMGNNDLFTQQGYQVWNWISAYPQIVNCNPDGTPEQMAVSVSHNWCKETHLTAFSNQTDTVFSRDYMPVEDRYDTRENAKFYGAYFTAQWERALEIDPEFVFITGWNEWTAGRYEDFWGVSNAFIDNFTANRSRDIEPSAGEMKDYYYYQMVSYIRKFKGTNAVPTQNEPVSIDLDSAEDPWTAVSQTFASYPGDTFDRNERGYKNAETGEYMVYKDDTGRNDIVLSKVAYDDGYVTFMAETAEAITPYTDPAWMRLLIEVAYANGETVGDKANWESFQYIVNRRTPESDNVTLLEASAGGWNWESVGQVQYRVSGNRIQIQIPRTMLGIENGDFILNFKWSDNMQTDGDIMDLYLHGDAAPGGRYKYQFVAGTPSVTIPNETGDENNPESRALPYIIGGGVLAAGACTAAGIVIRNKTKKKRA